MNLSDFDFPSATEAIRALIKAVEEYTGFTAGDHIEISDENVISVPENLYLNTYRYVSTADPNDSNLEFKGVIKMICSSDSENDYSYYKIISITGCLYVQGDYFGMANYYNTYNDDSQYVNITCIKNDGTEEEVITVDLSSYDDFESIELF